MVWKSFAYQRCLALLDNEHFIRDIGIHLPTHVAKLQGMLVGSRMCGLSIILIIVAYFGYLSVQLAWNLVGI
jgi:hypothetical protein